MAPGQPADREPEREEQRPDDRGPPERGHQRGDTDAEKDREPECVREGSMAAVARTVLHCPGQPVERRRASIDALRCDLGGHTE